MYLLDASRLLLRFLAVSFGGNNSAISINLDEQTVVVFFRLTDERHRLQNHVTINQMAATKENESRNTSGPGTIININAVRGPDRNCVTRFGRVPRPRNPVESGATIDLEPIGETRNQTSRISASNVRPTIEKSPRVFF